MIPVSSCNCSPYLDFFFSYIFLLVSCFLLDKFSRSVYVTDIFFQQSVSTFFQEKQFLSIFEDIYCEFIWLKYYKGFFILLQLSQYCRENIKLRNHFHTVGLLSWIPHGIPLYDLKILLMPVSLKVTSTDGSTFIQTWILGC